MRTTIRLIALLTLTITSACGLRLARMSENQKAERLAAEQGRVQELTNPVPKTKSYIVISEILLDFASSAIGDNDMTSMKQFLEQYGDVVTSARNVMWESDRDGERNPAGYRDLEIVLRGQIRRLQDISRILSVDDREPVETALSRATSAREDMLIKIFPQQPRQPAKFS